MNSLLYGDFDDIPIPIDPNIPANDAMLGAAGAEFPLAPICDIIMFPIIPPNMALAELLFYKEINNCTRVIVVKSYLGIFPPEDVFANMGPFDVSHDALRLLELHAFGAEIHAWRLTSESRD